MPLSSLSAPSERVTPPSDLEIRPKQVKALIQGRSAPASAKF